VVFSRKPRKILSQTMTLDDIVATTQKFS